MYQTKTSASLDLVQILLVTSQTKYSKNNKINLYIKHLFYEITFNFYIPVTMMAVFVRLFHPYFIFFLKTLHLGNKMLYHILVDNIAKILPCDKTFEFWLE